MTRCLFCFFAVLSVFFSTTMAACAEIDQVDSILEAVYRYQITHYTDHPEKEHVYFLSLHNKDPRASIMEHFKENNPPVKKLSKSESRANNRYQIYDKETGEKGVIFDIYSLKWINVDRVEVEGGYYKNATAGTLETFMVVRKNRRWVVEKSIVKLISTKVQRIL